MRSHSWKFRRALWTVSGTILVAVFAWTPDARAATVTWIGGDGDWNTLTNWSNGVLPGPDDDVVIDVPGLITVTHSSGTHSVKSLLSQEAFALTFSSLTVSNTIQINNGFSLGFATLVGGTVLRGTNGQAITVSGGMLDGVSLASDVMSGASLVIANGLTLVGGATIALTPPLFQFISLYINAGTQTIGGDGQIVLGGLVNLVLGNGGETTLTLGSNVTVRGAGAIGRSSSSTLLNQGTIQADVPGQDLYLSIPDYGFTNNGVLRATNGGTLSLTVSGNWRNTGSISVSNSTVDLWGSFTQAGLGVLNRTGGAVNLAGTLSGGLVLDATTGSWNLKGGTINGGTVSASGGAQLTASSGTLDGVILASDVSLDNNTSLSIANGLTLVGGAAITLNSSFQGTSLNINSGTQAIGGTGQIVLGGSQNSYVVLGNNGVTTLALGSNVTVHGTGSISDSFDSTLLNQGTIQADVPGQLSISLNSFTNNATLRATNGGTLSLAGNWVNNGLIHANDGGTVSLSGAFSLAGGTLNVGINSVTAYGHIQFSSPLSAEGTFSVNPLNGFRPNPGDTFPNVLTYPSATNEFTCLNGLDLGGGVLLLPQYGPTSLSLVATAYTATNSQPQLFITRSPTGVRLTWPVGFPGWGLQSNTNLSTTNWSPVSPQCDGQALLGVTTPQQYFRLHNQN